MTAQLTPLRNELQLVKVSRSLLQDECGREEVGELTRRIGFSSQEDRDRTKAELAEVKNEFVTLLKKHSAPS